MSRTNRRSIAYWILTGLLGLVFRAGGVSNSLHVETHIEIVATTLGYPEYLLTILGFAKLAGA